MKKPQDMIFISGVPFFANHGVFSEERQLGQKFILSMKLYLSLKTAGKTDDLSQSVHYGEITQTALDYLKENTFSLLEAAAEHVAEHLLITYSLLEAIEVTIEKPGAPVTFSNDHLGVCIYRSKHEAYLSIGSNMGDTKAHLDQGVKLLCDCPQITQVVVSDYLVTKPYGYTEQDDFLNGAVYLKTTLEAEELLNLMQEIEYSEKRERLIHWGPRTLDLDLIFFDDEIIDTDRLTVPHPEMEKRRFVLEPLSQIAGKKRHPILNKTVENLYNALLLEENEHRRKED